MSCGRRRAESCPARLLVGWATPRGAAHVVCRGYPGSYTPHLRTPSVTNKYVLSSFTCSLRSILQGVTRVFTDTKTSVHRACKHINSRNYAHRWPWSLSVIPFLVQYSARVCKFFPGSSTKLTHSESIQHFGARPPCMHVTLQLSWAITCHLDTSARLVIWPKAKTRKRPV